MQPTRTIAVKTGRVLELIEAPVSSSGSAFDVVRLPDGRLWPVMNQPHPIKYS